jgi:WD40 repeat protein
VPNPYHVRLAISQYGDRFRAELFTEDLGDTDGELLPADWRDNFERWMTYLEGGGGLVEGTDADIGAQLFGWLFGGGANRVKWIEVLRRLERDGNRPLRLLIDSSTMSRPGRADADADKIHNLPYGLLFDPERDSFLFRPCSGRPAIQYLRIVRRCTPRLLSLGPPRRPLRLLLAVAEPDGLGFGGPSELSRLAAALAGLPDAFAVSVCTPDGPRPLAAVLPGESESRPPESLSRLCRTTREQLESALREGPYDVLHLMAHGQGNGLVLCGADGGGAKVQGRELSERCNPACACTPPCPARCRLNPRAQMAFLQVCRAAGARGTGSFGALAQQLLNADGGDLAAVVASPYVLDAGHSTRAAVAFYQYLARGKEPDEALCRDLEMANPCWAFLELWVRPAALGGTSSRGAFQFASPYRGLSRFEERDADIFFGREGEVAELLGILRTEAVVAVTGDSGSGKSSLLQAGLVHVVRQQGVADRPGWQILSLRPGYHPGRSLLTALLLGEEEGMELPTPADWSTALHALFDEPARAERPLLLVFDQFEELFTLCADDAQRRAVAEVLARMAGQPDRFRLVLGIRGDYLGKAAALPGLGELIKRPWVLRPPGQTSLRAIVAGPAAACGYVFEGPLDDGNPLHGQGLLERILQDPLVAQDAEVVEGSAGIPARVAAPLPLLEFALERLWLKAVDQGRREFRHADFEELGGLGGAMARHAEEVYQSMPTTFPDLGSAAQKLAEQILTGLVSSRRTRRPRPRSDVQHETGSEEGARRVIDCLVGERLLTVRSDPHNLAQTQLDLAHEVLIERWDRLKTWLAENPETRALKEDFQQDTEKWEGGLPGLPTRSPHNLPGIEKARRYLAWLDAVKPTLTPGQAGFRDALRASVRRRQQIRRGVLVVMGMLLLAAVVAAGVAWWSAREAAQKERDAEAEKVRAQDAEKRAKRNAYAVSMALIQQAWDRADIGGAVDRLRQLMPPPGGEDLRGFEWYYFWRLCHRDKATLRTSGTVASATVSPDGRMLVSRIFRATADGRTDWAELWDVATGQKRAVAPGYAALIFDVAFSPDNKMVATVASDWTIRLWDRATGRELHKLPAPGGMRMLTFSADGGTLAGVADSVRLWDTTTGRERPTPPGPHSVGLAAFSPRDNRTLVVMSDMALERWDLAGDPKATVLEQQKRTGKVKELAFVTFSPRGEFLALGKPSYGESIVKVWDTLNWTAPRTLAWDGEEPNAVAFSPDGSTLALGTRDNTVRLWSTTSWQVLATLRGHTDRVLSVAFAPDGTMLATASRDRTVRLWRVSVTGKAPLEGVDPVEARAVLKGHEGAVNAVAFCPGGQEVASASEDGTVQLWDAHMSAEEWDTLPEYVHKDKPVLGISADGSVLAFELVGGGVQLWDVATGKVRATLKSEELRSPVERAAVSPKGKRVAFMNRAVVALWDVATGAMKRLQMPEAEGKRRAFRSILFSPDSATLASSVEVSDTRTQRTLGSEIKLWDAATGQERVTLPGVAESSEFGTFSPDGKTLALPNYDETAKKWNLILWGVDRGEHRDTLEGGEQIAFSPDGQSLAFRGNDQTIRLWHMSARQGRTLFQLEKDRNCLFLAFSPRGETLAYASQLSDAEQGDFSGQEIKLWDVTTGKKGASIPWPARFPDRGLVAFSPDGQVLALVKDDQAFKMDGRVLVGVNDDQKVKLWDVVTGQERATLRGPGRLKRIAFSPDSRTLAALGDQGPAAFFWRGATDAEVAKAGKPLPAWNRHVP